MSGKSSADMALDGIEPRLVLDGYRVIRHPSRDDLPPFLVDYRPDAVAFGPKKNILIEVKSGERPPADSASLRLRTMLEGREDWELRLIYFRPEQPAVESISDDRLAARILELKDLARRDPQAAFVLAWAALESASRNAGFVKERSLSARSTVSALATEGVVEPDETSRLFRLADLRNRISHGELDRIPSIGEVIAVLDIADRVRTEEAEPALR